MKSYVNLCTYCGKPNAETDDHIPPSCIFDKIKKGGLLKVPACRQCNSSPQRTKDDEYFRLMLIAYMGVDQHPSFGNVFARVLRGIARPEGRALGHMFLESTKEIELVSPHGHPLKSVPVVEFDRKRITHIVGKITRGLFLTRYGQRLPNNYAVIVLSWPRLRDAPTFHRDRIIETLAPLLRQKMTPVGNGEFAYSSYPVLGDRNFTFWRLRFYDAVDFFSTTAPRSELDLGEEILSVIEEYAPPPDDAH